MEEDPFSVAFLSLKEQVALLSSSNWREVVSSFCLISKHFNRFSNSRDVLKLLFISLNGLLASELINIVDVSSITKCCDYFFKLYPKSQALLIILKRLKERGEYFLAHVGTTCLKNHDPDFERELVLAIAKYYREQGHYRLSQFYFAYAKAPVEEMRLNEKLFSLEDRFWRNCSDSKNCSEVFQAMLKLGMLSRVERLLEEYAKLGKPLQDVSYQKVYDAAVEQCLAIKLKISGKINPPLSEKISNSGRVITRNSRTEANWSRYLKKELVLDLCKETEQELGAPPCEFSLVALGSLARDEACLYSDLEFAVIWKRKPSLSTTKEFIISYLRRFVLLLELKIISLGETRDLCFLGSLSEQQTKSMELLRGRIKRGFQFDEAGCYPYSSADEERFVFEVDSAALREKFLKSDNLVKLNIWEAAELYDETLLLPPFVSYLRNCISHHDSRRILVEEMLSIATYVFPKNTTHIDVKKYLIQPIQLGIKAMAIYYNVQSRSTLRRIDVLLASPICALTPQMAEVLKGIFSYAFKLRNELHSLHQSEHDEVPLNTISNIKNFLQKVYPSLKIFFDSWLKNPDKKNLEIEFLHEVRAASEEIQFAEFSFLKSIFPSPLVPKTPSAVAKILPPQVITSEYDFLFKFLIVGKDNVGKSAILTRFVEGTFEYSCLMTIGVDFKIRLINMEDKVFKLQIWDTPGRERFQEIKYAYYRGVHGVMMVFDVCDRESFESMRKEYADIVERGLPGCSIIMVGAKVENVEYRSVKIEEAMGLAAELGIPYMEVSAKRNINVEEAFIMLARLVRSKVKEPLKASQAISLSDLVVIKNPTNIDDAKIEVMKLLLLGDTLVGKTCLTLRYREDFYTGRTWSISSPEFSIQKIQIDNTVYKIFFFDTCGMEPYISKAKDYYSVSDGFLAVFDLTNRDSFFEIIERLEYVKKWGPSSCAVILVGAKSDDLKKRQVKKEEAEMLANELDVPYIEVSAKQNINVDEMFALLAKMVYLRKVQKKLNSTIEGHPICFDSKRLDSAKKILENIKNKVVPLSSPSLSVASRFQSPVVSRSSTLGSSASTQSSPSEQGNHKIKPK